VKPLTVLMTTDAVGGVYSYSLSLAEMLGRRGVRVHLASMGPPPRPDQVAQVEAIANVALHASDFDLEWMDDPWEDVELAGDWLVELEDRLRPDVVHLNGYSHGRFSFRAPVVSVAHSCVCSWWRAVHGKEAPSSWDRYRREVRRGLDGVAVVVAPTKTMLEWLARDHGPLPRSHVIPNGVALPRRTSGEKAPMFLAAGRIWDPAKNLALLDRVAKDLAWPVVVAGEESGPSGSRERLHSIERLGALSRQQMDSWLARAAVLIHPSLYEPFGLVPLEAAASGAALLLADIPTLREVWGEAALYFAPRDPHQLVELASRLASDEAARVDLARRARTRALQHSIEESGLRYLDLYRALQQEFRT
jgi:glycosyltransferase involved in cell wall biosynthesis